MRFCPREKREASYSFYVWENGDYVHVDSGQFPTDLDATAAARNARPAIEVIKRPDSLDSPHLHVLRDDGVHILTLELAD